MNLIGNSCIAAYLYRDWFKREYNNPFMWNAIDFNSFYYLAKHFNEINFTKFALDRYSELPNGYQIIVDGKVRLKYTHYLKDLAYDKPTTLNVDVHYKNIESYITDKYKIRLKRMMDLKEPPVFLVDASYTSKAIPTYTEENVKNFIKLNIPNKILLIIPPSYNIRLTPDEAKRIKLYRFRSGAKGVNAKTIYLRKILSGWV